MKKLFSTIESISRIMGWLGFVLTAGLTLMYTIDVIGRFFFNQQMKGTFELAQFFLCLITFSAFSFAQTARSHIHVGFIARHFKNKFKYCLAGVSFSLCTLICAIVTYCLWQQGTSSIGIKLTQVLTLPYAPIYYAASIFMAIFTLVIFTDVIRSVMALKGDEEAKAVIDKVYE